MYRFMLIGLMAWPWVTAAAPINYTRDQTLDLDLRGPRVEWVGEILALLPDGDYTCFLLQRRPSAYYTYFNVSPYYFIACNPGAFEVSTYFAGRELRVIGNLGPGLTRKIGDRFYNYPLIAGAFVELLPYPYYAPQYSDPFYLPPYSSHPYYRLWPY